MPDDRIDISSALADQVTANPGMVTAILPVSASSEQRIQYLFDKRGLAVTAVLAVAAWCAIVAAASVVTHAWAGPLAAILGMALAPVGLSGGFLRKA